ncbi:MAG: hypothetical protein R3F14_39925 [Polyangiaceae bacterium]
MELLRDRLTCSSGADYVLIDSRTGMTDVGNICTFQLPDYVVILFALHEQGIEGARRVAHGIRQAQAKADDAARLRQVFLLPSRVEEGGNLVVRDEWLLKVRGRLADAGRLLVEPDQRIPYAAELAYGEAVVVDSPTQSKLSVAYERLIDILAPPSGTQRPPSNPAPGRPSFRDLEASLERLAQNVQALIAKLSATAIMDVPFVHLQGFAQDVVQQRNGFLEELRKIRLVLLSLAEEVDAVPQEIPSIEPESSETAAVWEAILRETRHAVRLQQRSWVASRRRRIEAELLEVADQDAALADQAIEGLLPWLERGDWDEVLARLPILKDDIVRNGLDASLRANNLDHPRLCLSRPEPAARRAWLDERLRKLLTDGSLDEAVTLVLKNLMRLRAIEASDGVVQSEPPSPLHWSAFDMLCNRLPVSVDNAREIFDNTGRWMWSSMWGEILSRPAEARAIGQIGGPKARQHLELVLRTEETIVAPLVLNVAQGLLTLWRDGSRKVAQEIVRSRRDDAVLQAALARIGQMRAEHPRARRELLSPWLRTAELSAVDAAIAGPFAEALVEEGFDAEAFYFLEALRTIGGPPVGGAGFAELGFLLRAVETSSAESIEMLLSDKEMRDRISQVRPGRALFVLLAWQPFRLPENARAMCYSLQQALASTIADAPALPPSLLHLAESPIDFDVRTIAQVQRIVARVRAEYIGKRFRANWVASAHYENDFNTLVNSRLDALLGSKSHSANVVAEQEESWDPVAWMHLAFDEQRNRGLRTSYPEGDANKAIVRIFSEVRAHFVELARLRPSSGSPSLSEMLEQEEEIRTNTHSLRNWLRDATASAGAEARLVRLVEKSLAVAEEEDA